MGYTEDPQMVRVDVFRTKGKWYTTVAVKWDRYKATEEGRFETLSETLRRLMAEQHPNLCGQGWWAVCLEPYHENTHPQMVEI